jgi:hypothetical protein
MRSFKIALAAAAIGFACLMGAQAGDAANTYTALKGFAGFWEGKVTTDWPESGYDGVKIQLRIRVTSSGNAIVHEMGGAATGEGPEHMGDITVFYLENDNVLATHYCDADTRSRLKAVIPSDPNALVFGFVDVTGRTQIGYVQDITFKPGTADHHTEIVTFVIPGKRVMHAQFDLQKANP